MLPEFAAALRSAVGHYGAARGVIAHSMGATATPPAVLDGLDAQCLVLIAPVPDPMSAIDLWTRMVGLGPRIRARMPRRIEPRARRERGRTPRSRPPADWATAGSCAIQRWSSRRSPFSLPLREFTEDNAFVPPSRKALRNWRWPMAQRWGVNSLPEPALHLIEDPVHSQTPACYDYFMWGSIRH
jgi:hypothetical protein